MNKPLIIGSILLIVVGSISCSDVLRPGQENINDLENMYENASYAEGVLIDAYNLLPNNGYNFSDVATDNAVTNVNNNALREMAIGQWTANDYPLNQWRGSQTAIQYLNIFLANADQINWAEDENVRELFNRRMKGEAHGLRALFMFYLLQAHGGWVGGNQSGELLGIPIILEPQDKDSDFNEPRDTFEACMQQLYSDVEQAIELLPVNYGDLGGAAQLPDNYQDADVNDFNRVFGDFGLQRMSGRIAMAIRVKAALVAASPAFNAGTTTTWDDVATYAGELIGLQGGLSGIAPNGDTWYDNGDQINGLGSGANPPEIIWRTNVGQSSSLEQQNFPPTLFGDGEVNPTQNLVDAFPMANGFPIDHPNSGYDENNPYENRVPLLSEYVTVNGSTAGVNNTTIITAADGNTNDALNAVETSTRTGYYMRKLLRQNVNLDPTSTNTQLHFTPRIRYTEIYLAYAEAANEAWGPNGTGPFNFSSYDVISALRERQGITQPDPYLDSVSGSEDEMRALIHNVRRLELAFEDFCFWDLRRWNAQLNETALGVEIQNGIHTIFDVERRDYADYMYFGPIPRNEILKFTELQQNFGW